MLRRLKEKGITIFVSTPYMDEASQCDRIALIQEGRFLTVNTPKELINLYPHTLYGIKSGDMYRLLIDLERFEKTDRTYAFGEYHHLVLKEGAITDLEEYLYRSGHRNLKISRIAPTIEDCFLDYLSQPVQ